MEVSLLEDPKPAERHEEMYFHNMRVCKKCGTVKPRSGWGDRPCKGKIPVKLREVLTYS